MNTQSNVISIVNRIRPNTVQMDIDDATTAIEHSLAGFPRTIVAQATARAERLIRAGKLRTHSVDQALKWARCAEHDVPSLTA